MRDYKRDDLFIAGKVWANHFRYDDLMKAREASLNKLGIDYLDLYQFNWPNPDVLIGETMKATEELMDEGKIKNIGINNFSAK
nr:aldo/keto reductase [Thermoplasma volcanium]